MKEIEEIINKIIQIPNDFHSQKNKSLQTLLKESGYYDIHEQISVDAIIEILMRSHI